MRDSIEGCSDNGSKEKCGQKSCSKKGIHSQRFCLKLVAMKTTRPFCLMKPDPIGMSEVTGATNLMQSKNLEHSYTKLACE